MKQYRELVMDVVRNGTLRKPARENLPPTLAVMGRMLRFNMNEGFPLLTTKRVATRQTFAELLWMLRGDNTLGYLWEHKTHVWDKDFARFLNIDPKELTVDSEGGDIYGVNWRNYPGEGMNIDQITKCVNDMINKPESRKNIVTAWNPEAAKRGTWTLDACHNFFQINIDDDFNVVLQVNIRSSDIALGLPFNIAQYGLLLKILCDIASALNPDLTILYKPHELVVTLGNAHIYEPHIEKLTKQVNREVNRRPELQVSNDYVTALSELANTGGLDTFLQKLVPKMFTFPKYENNGKYQYDLFSQD